MFGHGRQVMKRMIFVLVSALASAVTLLFFDFYGFQGGSSNRAQAQTASRPNIVFVMTDDQPKDTMLAMPEVSGRVRDMGMTLSNAYVSESLCCPSRASMLRGQYPHNTDVERNGPPNGGLQTFRRGGKERSTVATLLNRGGYSTGLVGKYMNGYRASYKPPGWDYWYARAEASTPGQQVNDNGHVVNLAGKPGNWGDRFRTKAVGYLDRNTNQASDGPFALFLWTGQPHLQANDYADRYKRLYRRAALNPGPSFNEADVSDKPRWVRNLGRIDRRERDQLRQWRRNQLRSVRQVDDTVGDMLDLLRKRGELENTYVVFTSDNSTHMGEHRWLGNHGAKNTAYEEAANVPMFVRGPGIREGSKSDELVLNNDLAPTFARMARRAPQPFVDGRSLLPLLRGRNPAWRTAVMNERPSKDGKAIPTYHAAITARYTYVEYDTGEVELYDRDSDPGQLTSLHNNRSYAGAKTTLSDRLRALQGCAGAGCRAAEDRP
jgi:N-acetylglucosamine-6-sulfatase